MRTKQFSETEKLELIKKRLSLREKVSIDDLIELCRDGQIEELLRAHPEFFRAVPDRDGVVEWTLGKGAEKVENITEPFDQNNYPPMSIEYLCEILETTIKKDKTNKLISFFAMLLAYSKESQFNVSFRAPSTTGKSYIPLELSQYFPKEDLIMIAYSSPTSFYHDGGVWDDEREALVIDLEKKILIFLDQPHDQLLQRLRPLLSHDQKELLYKITDKREKKGLRTKNVIIKGFPSVIFCTGSLSIDEQEATRNFILSPETTEEKIREGIYLKALKKGNPKAFKEYLRQHPERETLKKRIERIKQENIKDMIISSSDIEKILQKFQQKYPRSKPRHQRDIERIISLIQGSALLNPWYRNKDAEGNIYVNDEDIQNGFKIFDQIADSQELGIPPFVYNIFRDVILPLWKQTNPDDSSIGLERKDIIKKHVEVFGRSIQDSYLRKEILPTLESSGLISQEFDPNDKRKKLIYVLPPPSNILFLQGLKDIGTPRVGEGNKDGQYDPRG